MTISGVSVGGGESVRKEQKQGSGFVFGARTILLSSFRVLSLFPSSGFPEPPNIRPPYKRISFASAANCPGLRASHSFIAADNGIWVRFSQGWCVREMG